MSHSYWLLPDNRSRDEGTEPISAKVSAPRSVISPPVAQAAKNKTGVLVTAATIAGVRENANADDQADHDHGDVKGIKTGFNHQSVSISGY